MILSASRRTDLPAFYSGWFLRRLREGFALVRNPRNRSQVSRVALTPETVDCIVFWTKDPAPILNRLEEIHEMGYEFYFQFTLNPYGRSIERYLPDREARVRTLLRLSRRIGRERVVWRYDPVILNDALTPEWHFRQFRELCGSIGDAASECVFSFADCYAKAARRAPGLMRPISDDEMKNVAEGFSEIAGRFGLPLKTCAEKIDLSRCGIEHGHCIDRRRIERLTGRTIRAPQDRGQRPGCGCAESVEIGAYNTCRHGCLYCYACGGDEAVLEKCRSCDPRSPLLAGSLRASDRVTERKTVSFADSQLMFR